MNKKANRVISRKYIPIFPHEITSPCLLCSNLPEQSGREQHRPKGLYISYALYTQYNE